MKTVVICGSSRKEGDTSKIVDKLIEQSSWEVINLIDYDIKHYDYEHQNRTDDFLSLMSLLVEKYDTFIFATPVYWYAMSGRMKVFFDRMTDLLEIEKELGRKLRGKKMAAMSCSNGDNLGDAFWLPFSESATYLGMDYLGNMHTIRGEKDDKKLKEFIDLIIK